MQNNLMMGFASKKSTSTGSVVNENAPAKAQYNRESWPDLECSSSWGTEEPVAGHDPLAPLDHLTKKRFGDFQVCFLEYSMIFLDIFWHFLV